MYERVEHYNTVQILHCIRLYLFVILLKLLDQRKVKLEFIHDELFPMQEKDSYLSVIALATGSLLWMTEKTLFTNSSTFRIFSRCFSLCWVTFSTHRRRKLFLITEVINRYKYNLLCISYFHYAPWAQTIGVKTKDYLVFPILLQNKAGNVTHVKMYYIRYYTYSAKTNDLDKATYMYNITQHG